jgi:alcohol dehydrogenase class IV
MIKPGRVAFSRMEEVVFGEPAAAAVAGIAERLEAKRVLVMASATLDRSGDGVAAIRGALGQRLAGQYQGMPAHSPRAAVLDATRQARAAGADLIVTVGGGSLTDAAKAVRLCLANDIDSIEAMDALQARALAPADPPRPMRKTVTTPSGDTYTVTEEPADNAGA